MDGCVCHAGPRPVLPRARVLIAVHLLIRRHIDFLRVCSASCRAV
ncbi:hypothetical protein [Embleya scabrispora]|nr:hypothetical protein [Embleya scabrispora]